MACNDDGTPQGKDAIQESCDSVLDDSAIRQAEKSEYFASLYVEDRDHQLSYPAAARAVLNEDQSAFACRLTIGDSGGRNKGFYVKFTPGRERLFDETAKRSYSSFRAYSLGAKMQATVESESADVVFPCELEDSRRLYVTSSLYERLDLSTDARLRTLFRSSSNMIRHLQCKNVIKFPKPETMKPFPTH
ncbi:hypothetical protein [Streptomyces djakartensis]|uniref:hypothetical protein n=1 Tax=Streptomyces djakartensis TaxID=68193 RepID=UPI0034DF695B